MFLLRKSLIFLCIVVNIYYSCSFSTPIVKISDGQIAGIVQPSWHGRPIYAFYGIPYAAPPVSKFRFKEPQPVKPWTGIWNASTFSAVCKAYAHFPQYSILGDEDCLHVNVFTTQLPSADFNPNLDVLVYIHGGAFMFGHPDDLGPEYLFDSKADNLVLVLPKYRLGPLGFISTGDDVVPGNNGLKDQVAALQWVQKNIAAFGGNPKSVTLVGQSAGGASVHYHFLSPLSDGLFHRGFSMSGDVLTPWALSENNVQKTRGLASTLGCPTHDSHTMIECLRSRPADLIVAYSFHLQGWRYNPFSPWGPSVEVNSSKPFLHDNPYRLLERGQVKDLPWMLSFVTDEGLYPVLEYAHDAEDTLSELDERWTDIAPHLLDFVNTIPRGRHATVSAEVRSHYFGNNSISMETYKSLIQAVGDRLYMEGFQRAVRLQAAANKAPVYLFHFAATIMGSLSPKYPDSDKNYGVSHSDDVGYIFKTSWGKPYGTEEEWALSRLLINNLISFAKSGVPIAGNVSLPPVSKKIKRVGELDYLEIKSYKDVKTFKSQNRNNYDFWTSLGYLNY